MQNIIDAFKAFFKNYSWNGAKWLFTLCFLLIVIVGIYVESHVQFRRYGKEYITLDKAQLKIIKKYLDNNVDTSSDKNDSARLHKIDSIRNRRTNLILCYLNNEYDSQIVADPKCDTCSILKEMKNNDVYDYLSDKRILVKSAFWLTGNYIYIEAFFWSLTGVLVSLIFYVSGSLKSLLKTQSGDSDSTAGTDDTGKFDPAEIPAQVAKMFYAPACTIVIILGYHYLADSNNNLVDLTVNKGMIVFSFIGGFYSGRLMKFLDKLKDLLLPYDGTDKSAKNNTDQQPTKPNTPISPATEEPVG